MLIFRAFREILKRLKGNIPKHPLVNETLETHLAKTKGFVFHTHHPWNYTPRYEFVRSMHFWLDWVLHS